MRALELFATDPKTRTGFVAQQTGAGAMAETVKVDLEDNSPYRVALDLAYRVAHGETGNKDRKYWLDLYAQCHGVVTRGWTADHAMQIGKKG
jgi:hypothetical protein